MDYATVCSGIAAPEVAWEALGWACKWSAQYDPEHDYKSGPDFASRVLAARFPTVPNLGDMTKLEDNETYQNTTIDLLCGGTPCQSFSTAGLRQGLSSGNGQLALQFVRILAQKRPRFFIWENVPGVFSSAGGRDFATILGAFTGRVIDVPPGGWRNSDGEPSLTCNHEACIVFDLQQITSPTNASACQPGQPAPTCNTAGQAHVFQSRVARNGRGDLSPVAYPLTAEAGKTGKGDSANILIEKSFTIRRLTPLEYERLQGFPDGWTNVPNKKGKPAKDGPRYSACGNSMAVPVMRWLGERIQSVYEIIKTDGKWQK